jgi:hypothetical protein
MNRNELKKILKPLIKECIKEVILEDGTLSTVVSEVVKGLNKPVLSERRARDPSPNRLETDEEARERRNKLSERKKKLLDSVGASSYNGVNVFEGTTPLSSDGSSQKPGGALSGISPNDAGVDISSFIGSSKKIWNKLSGN